MSTFGRYFRGLTAYDLLGYLIPGLILLGGLYGFSHVTVQDIGIVGVGVSLVSAFVLGGFIQRHASIATGERETFNLTISSTTELSLGDKSDDDTADGDTDSGSTSCFGYLANRPYAGPFLDPIFGWAGSPEGRELDDAVLTGRIRQHLVDAHDIPPDFEDFQVLYHLMISRLDSNAAPNRAVRIQALRNFYRGIWIATWWFCGLIAFSTVLVSVLRGQNSRSVLLFLVVPVSVGTTTLRAHTTRGRRRGSYSSLPCLSYSYHIGRPTPKHRIPPST